MPSVVLPLSIRCLIWESRDHFLLGSMYLVASRALTLPPENDRAFYWSLLDAVVNP